MNQLDREQLDAITELINIGVGRAASVLSEMTNERIKLDTPQVEIVSRDDIAQHIKITNPESIAGVQLNFLGSFSGMAALVFPPQSASRLVNTLSGDDDQDMEFDSVRIGTLTEVGNIVINGIMGSITNILHQRVKYSVPAYIEGPMDTLILSRNINDCDAVMLAKIGFVLQRLEISGDMLLLFGGGSLEVLLDTIAHLAEDHH